MQRVVLFGYTSYNAGRKSSPGLPGNRGHLWGIDHGITFHYQHKLRTVIWGFAGQPIPEEMMQHLLELCDTLGETQSPVAEVLKNLLLPRERQTLRKRIDDLVESRSFVQPSPGLNYPWPLVQLFLCDGWL